MVGPNTRQCATLAWRSPAICWRAGTAWGLWGTQVLRQVPLAAIQVLTATAIEALPTTDNVSVR